MLGGQAVQSFHIIRIALAGNRATLILIA